jgi:hypothetical protein
LETRISSYGFRQVMPGGGPPLKEELMPETAQARFVGDRADFDSFLGLLLSSDRQPVVAASVGEWTVRPEVDVEQLVRELEDAAHLYVLPSDATFWLTDAVGRACSVHSGWVRVYPAAAGWREHPARAPLIRPGADRVRTTRRIVEAVLEAAFRDGRLSVAAEAPQGSSTEAVVKSILSPTQVLVETTERRQAIMRSSRLVPGLAADRLVAAGQRFAGTFVPLGLIGEFSPEPVPDDSRARAIEFVGEGVVTSVRTAEVRRGRAVFQLHPDVDLAISAPPGQDLRTLVSEGDVVTVEVICVDGELMASFSADEPVPAMAMLPGGPPWVEPDRAPLSDPVLVADELADALSGIEVATEDAEGGQHAALADLEAQVEAMQEALQAKDALIRRLQAALRKSRRFSLPVVHSDPDEQFRLELRLDYLTRVEEASRTRYPWPRQFVLGPEFISTVDALVAAGGISREKIVEVCTEVLCGRANEMDSRAVKAWTATPGGPQLSRRDGAVAFRVRLQSGTAAARRLRYWLLPNGDIELDRVGVHDAGL